MENNQDPPRFLDVREDVMETLGALQLKFDQATDLGMKDPDEVYYNELLALMDDAAVAGSWDELGSLIYKAQTLEVDIDSWLSRQGVTTIGLEWPPLPS